MKLFNSLKAVSLMMSNTRIFRPEKIFAGKRVAVIGAAETAFQEKNGDYIESFDLVVRVNKAIHSWKSEDEEYIGRRTDVLFHSFFENQYSGGGPMDFNRFMDFGVEYVVHPNRNFQGSLAHLNFYKRHLQPLETYMLDGQNYQLIKQKLKPWIPTVGFSALASVLNSSCREVYITGFTFFKTSYAKGYRDHFRDLKANAAHIEKQGLHNPEQEFKAFLELLHNTKSQEVHCDKALNAIVKQ